MLELHTDWVIIDRYTNQRRWITSPTKEQAKKDAQTVFRNFMVRPYRDYLDNDLIKDEIMISKSQLAHELGMHRSTLIKRVRAWWDCQETKPFVWTDFVSWRALSRQLYERLKLEL